MNKKNIWRVAIALVIIIAIILLVSQCGGTIKKGLGIGGPSKNELAAKNDSLLNELASYKSYTSAQYDSISTLNSLLDDCIKGKRHRRTTSTATKKTVTTQTGNTTPAPSHPAREKSSITVPGDSPSLTENTGLAGDKYKGVYNGSHGVTINEDSKLVYFISNEELNAGEGKMTISAPILNGDDPSQEFYWDAQRKLWICESNTIITINRLLSGVPIIWCAYIGTHPQWGYKMFDPHEIFKTGSASAKTALAKGEIAQHPNDVGCDYVSHIQYEK